MLDDLVVYFTKILDNRRRGIITYWKITHTSEDKQGLSCRDGLQEHLYVELCYCEYFIVFAISTLNIATDTDTVLNLGLTRIKKGYLRRSLGLTCWSLWGKFRRAMG